MSIISRYIINRFLRVFAGCTAGILGLFVFIDFFSRIGNFLDYNPRTADLIAMFVLKIPGLMAELFPLVCLFAVLVSLGMLTRHRETLAMSACGITTWQIARPLVMLTGLACIGVMLMNELVVPATSSQSRFIRDVVIKKKPFSGRFNASSVWLQGQEGFFNIDYYDANNKAAYGLTLYETGPKFQLNRVVEVQAARWRDDRWQINEGKVKAFGPDGGVIARELEPGEFKFTVKPTELVSRPHDASEFSFAELLKRIELLRSRGLTTAAFEVDLHAKIARPFAGLLMVLLGLPIAIRGGRSSSVAYGIGLGLGVGFLYWSIDAVAISAGRSGGLLPIISAWAANGLFATFAATFYVTRVARTP